MQTTNGSHQIGPQKIYYIYDFLPHSTSLCTSSFIVYLVTLIMHVKQGLPYHGLLRFLLVVQACVSLPPTPTPFTVTDFNDNVVFIPGSDYTSWGTIYARPFQLPDNSLLMTWENYPLEPPLVHFPIYTSANGGATWSKYSEVHDLVNG